MKNQRYCNQFSKTNVQIVELSWLAAAINTQDNSLMDLFASIPKNDFAKMFPGYEKANYQSRPVFVEFLLKRRLLGYIAKIRIPKTYNHRFIGEARGKLFTPGNIVNEDGEPLKSWSWNNSDYEERYIYTENNEALPFKLRKIETDCLLEDIIDCGIKATQTDLQLVGE
jgi:hypothetical protein